MRVLLKIILLGAIWVPSLVDAQAYFVENQGQWDGDFSARLELKQGAVFFRSSGYKILLLEPEAKHHQHSHDHHHPKGALAFEAEYIGAKPANRWQPNGSSAYPRNYFLGNDPNRWKSNLGSYSHNLLEDYLPGIDLLFYEQSEKLKYDLKLDAEAHPESIKVLYHGLKGMRIVEGKLHLQTAYGDVIESIPYSYQIIKGERKRVRVEYELSGDTVSFKVKGYKEGYPLVIDPVLEFATFSGSADLNFGNSAAYGDNGSIYGAGVNFGANYPVTNGVFQAQFAGDSIFNVDVSISKFDASGAQLLYATYLGGKDIEVVHSIISDDQGNLVILGNTGSSDFPVDQDAYQSIYGGGDFQTSFAFNDYNNGSDLFISRLSSDGSSLLGSTYWGGSANDGFNKDIYENYGDHYRGEVELAPDGKILVVNSTFSMDVPLAGANSNDRSQNSQDAIIGLFDTDLQNLVWGRYYGGLGAETGYSLQPYKDRVYICGSTTGADLLTTTGCLAPSQIGENDAYIVSFEINSGNIINASRYGTSQDDQAFMVDVDYAGDVYITGHAKGSLVVSPGVYSAAGSRQYIAKLDSSLSVLKWQTLVGSGQNKQDFVPSAFMVDRCLNIYLSGWNGQSNVVGFPGTQNGNTFSLPTTGDAYQNSTDGSDFYFMILGHNANQLLYASYLGGQDNEHVDGGTSRFSKDGTIYQAVCSNCNNQSFPTTAGAYSPSAGAPGCNMAVFKFSFNQILDADARINYSTSVDSLCDGLIVNLRNGSINATNYKWYFGNGDSSSLENPSVTYRDLGSYEIRLIAYDTICQITDTAFIFIEHGTARKPITDFQSDYTGCDQNLEAKFNNLSIIANAYQWNFGDGSSSTDPNPRHKFPGFGTYQVELIAYDTICMRSDTTFRTITFVDSSYAPEIAANVSECSNGEVDIALDFDRPNLTYLWDTEGKQYFGRSPAIRFETPGLKEINLKVEDTLCSKVFFQNFKIQIDEIRNEVYAPNAFTPNGDNLNDQFQIFGDPCKQGAYLQIFNRWGAKVYETEEPYIQFWDGTIGGSPAPGGVYTYILLDSDKKTTGYVSLIR
ncbi:MAG: PKD domain-containing protein [Bacteroidetes bacterium]|nr:PKD domain-containing protein [Bacteroidota bacterium]